MILYLKEITVWYFVQWCMSQLLHVYFQILKQFTARNFSKTIYYIFPKKARTKYWNCNFLWNIVLYKDISLFHTSNGPIFYEKCWKRFA